VVAGAIMVAVLVAIWLFAPRGLLVTYRVTSESMVPTLIGPHYAASCPNCGFPARWIRRQDTKKEQPLTRCPNCRSTKIASQTTQGMPGDRVQLESRWHTLVPFERFDIVAFENDHAEFAVKRIAGLPGETIAINHGELRVNERLLRKSAEQFRQVAILVHDDRYRPADAEYASVWSATHEAQPRAAENVNCVADGFQFLPTNITSSAVPWLIYQHRNHHGELGPITDDYYENTHVSRQLNFVHDIAVTAQIEPVNTGTWLFGLSDGDHEWVIRWSPESQRVTVEEQGEVVLSRTVRSSPAVTRSGQLLVAICDFQLLLQINDQTLLRWEYPESYPRSKPPSAPLRLAWQGSTAARVRELSVWRDWYITHPLGLDAPWHISASAAANGYFLLGDNLPVSVDGRTNPLTPHKILGRAAARCQTPLRGP
jgi:signal peptidase I